MSRGLYTTLAVDRSKDPEEKKMEFLAELRTHVDVMVNE